MGFRRAFRLVRYNWPLYLFCLGTTFLGFLIAANPRLFLSLRLAACGSASLALWFAISSFTAFHLMFDRSEFLIGNWLRKCIRQPPKTCVQLSVCVEETTLPLAEIFPEAKCTNLDLFDDSIMTEPAIARAKNAAKASSALPANPATIPLASGASDFTVVTLAAHEIRERRQRELFFQELTRITQLDGRVVIAEHLRNLPAALAFGPGSFHFYKRSEWLDLAKMTGFQLDSEFSLTPFLHVFVLRRLQVGQPNGSSFPNR